ncbi:hypothetical protein BKM31_14015 [[Actinomadura] parvosata subsp. kistnae]|uniref:Uncharacterized protein n=1 Tax=[Actinomadura] parvosata subsp. kistnae TaxID=1909395 RepID=A0A1U9ZWZ2_9ACTN|nr:hypothetical protein BKM31_14015 [Nonomuraea sp. ATCC 55076]
MELRAAAGVLGRPRQHLHGRDRADLRRRRCRGGLVLYAEHRRGHRGRQTSRQCGAQPEAADVGTGRGRHAGHQALRLGAQVLLCGDLGAEAVELGQLIHGEPPR